MMRESQKERERERESQKETIKNEEGKEEKKGGGTWLPTGKTAKGRDFLILWLFLSKDHEMTMTV